MNTDFYENIDTNFEQACYLCDKEFRHDELNELLKNGNIPQKQIAALKYDYVNNEIDAQCLVSVLTGCDGKIREAVALRIFQFINKNTETRALFASMPAKIFADATIDINANICRLVVDSVKLLKEYGEFSQCYTNYIVNYTLQALDELDKFIFRDKKYVINKQLFKLYWCLEALKFFYEEVDTQIMCDILTRSANQSEYTVREKTAQIAILSDKFKYIREILKDDANYYVKNLLK